MEQIVYKLNSRSAPDERGMSLAPTQNREVVLSVDAWSLERMQKQAHVSIEHPQGSTFSITCDEGPYLNGDDQAPPPLAYFCSGAAFCVLTQLSRYAAITKLQIERMSLKLEARFLMEGAVLRGTLTGQGLKFETHLSIHSVEPPEKIADLVRVGEQSCFVMQSLMQPVPCQMHVELNDQPLELPT